MLKTPAAKWNLYDRLIDLVPRQARTADLAAGRHWLMVKSDQGGIGLAQRAVPAPLPDSLPDSLRELAGWLKSWDFSRAALGMAAVNAAVNTPEQVEAALAASAGSADAFDFFRKEARGRKAAVIGHFPYLDGLREQSEVYVLERNPLAGDLPDPAAEYILPDMDYVFLTSTSIINKTLPRLLELAQGAKIVLVGPTTPLTPLLFEYGAAALAGLAVSDSQDLAEAIKKDSCQQIFRSAARKVNLLRPFQPALS
jgi:uncharacterized protein (DUF4213/DUF364 family)